MRPSRILLEFPRYFRRQFVPNFLSIFIMWDDILCIFGCIWDVHKHKQLVYNEYVPYTCVHICTKHFQQFTSLYIVKMVIHFVRTIKMISENLNGFFYATIDDANWLRLTLSSISTAWKHGNGSIFGMQEWRKKKNEIQQSYKDVRKTEKIGGLYMDFLCFKDRETFCWEKKYI